MPDAYRGREQAYIKHRLLEAYLEKLFLIIGMSAQQLGIKELCYVDCFAGPWGDESVALDSTSIAVSLRVLAKCRRAILEQGVRVAFRALYIEKDRKSYGQLAQYLNTREPDGIDADPREGDSVDLRYEILKWAGLDSFAFFFIDPMGWTPVSVGVLQPLLARPRSEFLINFMYNFVNRAIGMEEQQSQIKALLGEVPSVSHLSARERERALIDIYRRNLMQFMPTPARLRARSAYVRVLDPGKNRPKYHLVYLTTHPRGIVEFMQISEKLDLVQKRVRAATQHRRRAERTRIDDLFAADTRVMDQEGHASPEEVEQYWLTRLSEKPQKIGWSEFADILEQTNWFPGDLQEALGNLMARGRVRNLDAAGKRRKKYLHFEKEGERLQLIKGKQ